MVKTYLKGLFPFAFIFFINNLNPQTGAWILALSWLNLYLVVSYLVFFPLLYGQSHQRLDNGVDIGKKLERPQEGADQKAMRMGSNYGSTGHFGFARIGDAQGKENGIERWGISLVLRLFLILAGPLAWGYLWWRQWRRAKNK